MRIDARYFDGVTAVEHRVQASTDGIVLYFSHADRQHTYDLKQLTILPPVGRGDWAIDFDDGARLLFSDPEFAGLIMQHTTGPDWAGRLENSWRWAIIALVVAVAGTYGILNYGIPAAAKHIAFAVPPHIDAQLSGEGLGALDRLLFESSELDVARQQELQALFADITARNAEFAGYVLVFRRSPRVGANAFALPGGTIVMTDEMVELAESDDELLAVLAHEVGHQANRHLLRIILQDSVGALLIASLTGDLTSVTALAASIPTVLMQSKYSRDFEREADAFAFNYLASEGKDPKVLRELLLRLEERSGEAPGSAATNWFSSHPDSSERAPE